MIPPDDEDLNVTKGGFKDDGTDEEDGGGGYITWVIIGVVIVFLAIVGFAAYKIYQAKKGRSTIKVQDISLQHVGNGGASNEKKEPSSKPNKENEHKKEKEHKNSKKDLQIASR